MHKAAGDFMAEWNKAIEEDDRAVEGIKKGGTKRAAPVMDVSAVTICYLCLSKEKYAERTHRHDADMS